MTTFDPVALQLFIKLMCPRFSVLSSKSLSRLFLAAKSSLFLTKKRLLAFFLLFVVLFLVELLGGLRGLLGSLDSLLSFFLDCFGLVSSLRDNQALPTGKNRRSDLIIRLTWSVVESSAAPQPSTSAFPYCSRGHCGGRCGHPSP